MRCLNYIYNWKHVGIDALYSYRVGPLPSSDVSGIVDDKSKPSDYFGRDTIANAAAKVAPAVVNISTHQGICLDIFQTWTFELCPLSWLLNFTTQISMVLLAGRV